MKKAMTIGVMGVLAACGLVQAEEVQIPITGTVDVDACAQGACDDDTSTFTGWVILDVDDVTNPSSVTLTGYRFDLDETVNFNFDLGFGGSFAIDASDMAVEGPVETNVGPIAVVSDTVVFTDVPGEPEGLVAYAGSGLICLALDPCSGSFELENSGTPVFGDEIALELVYANGELMLSGDFDFGLPIGIDGGVTGDVVITGSMSGSVEVEEPCPCDWNQSGTLNDDDFFAFLGDFFGGAPADFNGSGTTNDDDFFGFLGCFFGSECM